MINIDKKIEKCKNIYKYINKGGLYMYVTTKKKILIIFILTCIFILCGLANKVEAKTFSDFKTNPELFCLDRGYCFRSNNEYSSTSTVRVTKTNVLGNEDAGENISNDNCISLAYIISQLYNKTTDFPNNPKYGKTSIGGYVPQVAVWKILTPKKPLPSTSSNYETEGKNLAYKAIAYKNFVKSIGKDYSPKIEKDASFSIENGYIGPFTIQYNSESYENVTYGDIVSMQLKSNSTTYEFTKYIKKNGEYVKINRMPKSGEKFYIKMKNQNPEDTSFTLSIKQEGIIEGTIEFIVYKSTAKNPGWQYQPNNNETVFFEKVSLNGTSIFCTHCMENHELKLVKVIDDVQGEVEMKLYVGQTCPYAVSLLADNKLSLYAIEAFFNNGDGAENVYVYIKTLSQEQIIQYQRILHISKFAKPVEFKDSVDFVTIPNLRLDLKKQNTVGTALSGAKVKIKAVQDGKEILPETEITLPQTSYSITPKSKNDITVTIKETKVPEGHIGIINQIIIKYTFNGTEWVMTSVQNGKGTEWTLKNGKYVINNDTIKLSTTGRTITIYNRPKVDFTLIKLDKIDNSAIKNILFNIKIQNAKSGPTNIIADDLSDFDIYTDTNGKILLENLEFTLLDDVYKPIIITLKEKESPTDSLGLPKYMLLNGEIIVTINYTVEKGKAKITTELSYNEEDDVSIIEGTNVKVTAKDTPMIHLGGKVWLDVPQGLKPTYAPDGVIQPTEEGIAGMPVYLFKTEDGKTFTKVEQNIFGTALMTETAEGEVNIGGKIAQQVITYIDETGNSNTRPIQKGEYFFPNLPKLGVNGYYVIYYSYDGINYISTRIGDDQATNDQKANEDSVSGTERNNFNKKFMPISADTEIKQQYFLKENGDVIVDRTNQVLEYDTYNYNNNLYKSILKTTSDFDTNTHENGKEVLDAYRIFSKTISNYSDTDLGINFGIQERYVDLSLMNDIYSAEVSINGKTTLYSYDDIINQNGIIEIDATTGEEPTYGTRDNYELNLYKSDYQYGGENKLKIYVTYEIALNNQGIVDLYGEELKAKINKFVDYYDVEYILDKAYIKDSNNNENIIKTGENGASRITIDGREYKKLELDLSSTDIGLQEGSRKIVYLRFRVDGEGSTINLKEYANIAEISSYSTDTGLVDKDSAPDNAIPLNGETTSILWEDDTDKALGIDIVVPGIPQSPTPPEASPRVRTISGNVFEDIKTEKTEDYTHGNGIKDSGENGISNITVELIDTNNSNNRYTATTTDVGGNYTFTGFIPGEYIVKFTYNETEYNGKNYKSTIVKEEHYNNEIINSAIYNKLYGQNGGNTSKAIDNPQERLRLMSNFVQITKDTDTNIMLGIHAETPTIHVFVDTDNFGDITNPSLISDGNNPRDITITGVNFGLEKRAETKVSLEEHIKRLKLTGNDGIDIVQAEVNDENSLFNGSPKIVLTGIKDGLRAIKTVRNNFGSWTLITDIGEVLQGAKIEVEYVYQVKNNSDIDYLSQNLINMYNTKSIEEYKEYLNSVSRFNKMFCLNLLGKTYYTGIVDNTVAKVPTEIEEIKDYTNNLKYKSGEEFEVKSGGTFNILKEDGLTADETIEQVLLTKNASGKLLPTESKRYYLTLLLDGLSPTGKLDFENYISQIMSYTNAAGTFDRKATPGNLEGRYIYTYDRDRTLEDNEIDEFSAEDIKIEPPTGKDEKTGILIITSIIAGLTIIAGGVVLIKKIVIK